MMPREAIVFGGSSGLGAAVVRELSKKFNRVLIADLQDTRKSTTEVDYVQCDVSSEKEVRKALNLLPEVSVAVNCAGVGLARKTLSRKGLHSLEDFEGVFRINAMGSFNVSRLAAERFSQRDLQSGQRGLIINTASIAAYEGQRGQVAYSASKGAVVAMTLPLARDLAQYAIRVVTIAPGLFRTPLLDDLPESVQTSLAESIPFPNRLGLPTEFAQLVMAIIENPYINGTVIRLDAALRMPPS